MRVSVFSQLLCGRAPVLWRTRTRNNIEPMEANLQIKNSNSGAPAVRFSPAVLRRHVAWARCGRHQSTRAAERSTFLGVRPPTGHASLAQNSGAPGGTISINNSHFEKSHLTAT